MNIRKQVEFGNGLWLDVAGVLECQEIWQDMEHHHAYWQLLFLAQGRGTVRTSAESWELTAGQGILMRPQENHIFTSPGENTVLVYVGFRCGSAADTLMDQADRLLFRRPKEDRLLREILIAMARQKTADAVDGNELFGALLPLAERLRRREEKGDFCPDRNQLCEKTIRFLRENKNRFVTVEEIAAGLFVTPHYLGMLFSSCMGMTILKYQQKLKLETATKMIMRGEASIAEVAAELGYSSPQYFSKCFREQYGYVPTVLKKTAASLRREREGERIPQNGEG